MERVHPRGKGSGTEAPVLVGLEGSNGLSGRVRRALPHQFDRERLDGRGHEPSFVTKSRRKPEGQLPVSLHVEGVVRFPFAHVRVAPLELDPSQGDFVDTPETRRVGVAAPVEAAPVEAAPVEAAPVEPAPVEPAPVEPAPQTDQDQDGNLDGTDQCPTQAEVYNNFADGDGCPDSVEELVDLARQNVDQYWRQVFANAQVPYYSPNAVMGYRGTIETECGTALPQNAFYCFVNRTIYYDIDFVQDQLLTLGDFAPVVIIAHEWGHFIQHQLRIWHIFTIQFELQADCFAGAYAQHANQVGQLQQGDLEEGAASLYNAGDYAAWFEPGAHSTPEQRREQFMRGFNEGLGVCF